MVGAASFYAFFSTHISKIKTNMNFKILYFIFVGSICLFSCKNTTKPKEEINITTAAPVETTPGIATVFKVNVAKSSIDWSGSSLHGKHNGSINISSGRINTIEENITTGDFDIDVKSIAVLDLKGEEKIELETHLKGNDFFDAEKFPLGRFIIKKVEKISNNPSATHQIVGDLILKDVSNPVSFLANIKMAADRIEATSNTFTINRAKWGVSYGSTLLGVALDKAIKDDIVLQIKLIAEK